MVSEPMATNTTQPPTGVTKQHLVSNMSNMIMESQVKCVNLKLSLVYLNNLKDFYLYVTNHSLENQWYVETS